MYIALMGTTQQGSGPAALAGRVESNGEDAMTVEGIIGESFPVTSDGAGVGLSFSAIPTGGDGNYTFAWSIDQQGDTDNIGTGNIQITNAGTQTGVDYDDFQITINDAGRSGGDFIDASLFIRCTVTDGTGATQALDPFRFGTIAIYLE